MFSNLGYGLAMMVEVLCGILAGATYGPNIRKWGTTERVADLVRVKGNVLETKYAKVFL